MSKWMVFRLLDQRLAAGLIPRVARMGGISENRRDGRTNREEGMSIPVWITDLFRAIDEKDAERFAGFLTDDATFRFANAPPAVGADAIRAAVSGFFGAIRALSHELTEAWEHPSGILVLGQVTYTRLDGSVLSVPFADVFRMRGGKVAEYDIYLDASALFQPPV
jgi:ketosteroid isomerase-like protein